MKNFARRIAVVIGAVAVSAGLIGASAMPAEAASAGKTGKVSTSLRDSSWPL
ncbi:MAG TPA: hypothetical protein PLZ93_19010 [Nocardioides sp.]|uniref:hypothetical protein n=1 Tax=uncultured Nocardioides sp. TaxID=198441 RepID=UPI0026352058|nr:hypothetical protein [uncultured Nocardioides sp.]HRD63793.1 hypothetical protein [Nocardioides sp.]HRI97718.1 hypothetical protein [Nocardioides sp.]HRK47340.1 hypothetical protein [Nocardioides sp.]